MRRRVPKCKECSHLLVVNKNPANITFVDDDEVDREERYKVLNLDYFNEIFCQDLGSAVRLSVKVLTVNFGNFFDGLGIPFGSLMDAVKEKHSQSTESLTQPLSAAI